MAVSKQWYERYIVSVTNFTRLATGSCKISMGAIGVAVVIENNKIISKASSNLEYVHVDIYKYM